MKTMKILSVISLVLIGLGAAAIKPNQPGQSGISQPPGGNIKHQVVLHVSATVSMPAAHFYVVITDGNGRQIARPQLVVPGVVKYYFSEMGPVNGTRIVRLIEKPSGDSFIPYSCEPDAKTGLFRNGVTYIFNLYPSLAQPD
jgi:hypothetical protein